MIMILAIHACVIDVPAKHYQRVCRYCIAIVNNGMLITSIPWTEWFHCEQLWPKTQLYS